MKLFISLLIASVLVACNRFQPESAGDPYATLPDSYSKVLKAHGGLEAWKSFKTLEYDLKHEKDSVPSEHYILDLENRKDLTVADSFKIGFDGAEVWVAPNKKAFKGRSARFYHNLYSYFLTMPFIVADPGVKYADDTITVDGKSYQVLSISFSEGVGDADEDTYKMLINPSTHRMEKLLYTVTFYSGQAHENYNALSYEDWEEIEGLILPTKLVGYKYSNGEMGDKRYEVIFSNIRLSSNKPNQELFAMPANAEIDSLKTD